MNALTLHQPWASLVAVGAKTIETRSWRPPAAAIGERLVIHASKARPDFSPAPIREACYTYAIGVWEQRPNEPWGSLVCVDDTQRFVPRGVVVASCVLGAVCQTEHMAWCSDEAAPEIGYRAGFEYPAGPPLGTPDDNPPHRFICAPESERPFGDFSPGRFAWLLQDVQPTSERCPWCWGNGRTSHRIPGVPAEVCERSSPCPVCWPRKANGEREFWADGRSGKCDPIPASGHQRIWQWEPEEARA